MSGKTFEMTMLLDFYGELLTERQRECMNMHYNEDLSLAEIAEIVEITRQGVRDLLVRAEATLMNTEAKTGIVRRFSQQRAIAEKMSGELKELESLTSGRARELAQSIKSDLEFIIN